MKINKKRLCEIRTAADKVLVAAVYMNVDAGETSGLEKENTFGGAVDIIKIAHAYGFVVGNASFVDDTLGFIIVNGNNNLFTDCKITLNSLSEGNSVDRINRLICINRSMKPQHKRFLIAYELGHYIPHFDTVADGGWARIDRPIRPGRPKRETREADAFAKYLLMPEGSFSAKYYQFKNAGLSVEEIYLLLAKNTM